MLTIVFAGIILILLCIWIAWKRFEFCHIMSAVPGPKAWPIVGNALQLKRDPHGTRYLECIARMLSLHLYSFLPIVSIFLAFVRSLALFIFTLIPANYDYICRNLQALIQIQSCSGQHMLLMPITPFHIICNCGLYRYRGNDEVCILYVLRWYLNILSQCQNITLTFKWQCATTNHY
jgi:hypothetical protein